MNADYAGKLQAAAGGTLFLDEVAKLPPAAQTRLLRFLDSGEVQRIGSTDVATIDARIIAATNVDLEQGVAAGTVRRDLYFRLNVIPLRIPPMRSRREDIAPLAEAKRQFERRYLQRQIELHGGSVKRTAEALGILPNNLSRRVRQLESGDNQHTESE